jgi:hypothetical protein
LDQGLECICKTQKTIVFEKEFSLSLQNNNGQAGDELNLAQRGQ